MSSANAAARRRAHYAEPIAKATGRQRFWQIWRWLLAEILKQSAEEQDRAAERLHGMADELNRGWSR